MFSVLCDKSRVQKLLWYVVEEPRDDTDTKRTSINIQYSEFSAHYIYLLNVSGNTLTVVLLGFISSEIFTSGFDVILKTLVEDDN